MMIIVVDGRNQMSDSISRQTAIDAFYKYPNINWTTLDVLAKINALPSAQPEIITCTECKYYDTNTEQCNNDKGLRFIDFSNPERMWCSWAERQEK